MKLNISFKTILKSTAKFANIIAYVFIAVFAIILLNLIYQNIYLTVITPKEINKNEIIAKKQKVNLELFNGIIQKIEIKQNIDENSLKNLKNPFQPQ